jgi:peroxiredoxin
MGAPPSDIPAPADLERESNLGIAADIDSLDAEDWTPPPFQILRSIAALMLTALGFALYEYVKFSFWSSPDLGIHLRYPWPAYAMLALALFVAIAGVRVAFGLWSPHAKLGFGLLALLACVVVGVDGGRFVRYTTSGTLNPPFSLKLAVGDHFPAYALADQRAAIHRGPASAIGTASAAATLIYVYRGDFCPFARFELADLTAHQGELRAAGVDLVAISADPIERSQMLANFLRTDIPLLSDSSESILGPLGLVQHHRDGQPDNAIPAFVIVDRDGIVRWIYTSMYYRQLPTPETILEAARSVVTTQAPSPQSPPASPS